MIDLLFASPWWLFAALLLIGGILFWSGNNKQQRGMRNAGIALVLLAILLKGISYLYETDKEKVTRQSNELVAAVQARDWTKFESYLDPHVRLGTASGTLFPNRDALVKGARADAEAYNLTNLSARVNDVEQDQLGISVDIDASSEQSASMGYQIPSSWKLTWIPVGKEWRLHEIICTRIGNEKVDEINRLLGK